jgi:hypothetical protein
MSLDPSDLEHDEAIALLQPFVDGELADAERDLVARQIADNPSYQAFVREQQQVRATLRALARESAPPELRARIVGELDVIMAERQRGRFAPVLDRMKSFGRGAMLMVPAAAAAGVLFLVTSNSGIGGIGGWFAPELPKLESAHVDGAIGRLHVERPGSDAGRAVESGESAESADAQRRADSDALDPVASEPAPEQDQSLPSGQQLEANLGFPVQVVPARSLPQGVALVTDSASAPGSSAMVRYGVGGGAVVVDRQRRAGVGELGGARQVFRGHAYYLARDNYGRPQVGFQLGFVQHELVLEGAAPRSNVGIGVDEADFQVLLSVADALRQAHG